MRKKIKFKKFAQIFPISGNEEEPSHVHEFIINFNLDFLSLLAPVNIQPCNLLFHYFKEYVIKKLGNVDPVYTKTV